MWHHWNDHFHRGKTMRQRTRSRTKFHPGDFHVFYDRYNNYGADKNVVSVFAICLVYIIK